MQQKHKDEESRKKGVKSLMQRNVTDFQHLLTNCYITESDLNWTMNLRDGSIPKKIQHREPSAPEVFFKKTMISTIRDQLKSKESKDELKTINVGEYGHMMTHKLEKTPEKQTLEQLKFYQDLRKDKKFRFGTTKSSKQFDVLPYKDKHQYPAFIKKQFVKKVRVSPDEVQSAFDGAQNQQPYTNKFKTKNYATFEPMTKVRGRNRVVLPTLAWQMGLRNY